MEAGSWIRTRLERAVDVVIEHVTPLFVTAAAGVLATVNLETAVVGVLAGGSVLMLINCSSRQPSLLQSR